MSAGYDQDLPFHNFHHCVAVLQGCYAMLRQSEELASTFTPIDRLALCAACLFPSCHPPLGCPTYISLNSHAHSMSMSMSMWVSGASLHLVTTSGTREPPTPSSSTRATSSLCCIMTSRCATLYSYAYSYLVLPQVVVLLLWYCNFSICYSLRRCLRTTTWHRSSGCCSGPTAPYSPASTSCR